MAKQLKRSKNKTLCGVCGGLAEYLDLDPTIIRVIYAVFTFFTVGTGLLLYLILALIMPE